MPTIHSELLATLEAMLSGGHCKNAACLHVSDKLFLANLECSSCAQEMDWVDRLYDEVPLDIGIPNVTDQNSSEASQT